MSDEKFRFVARPRAEDSTDQGCGATWTVAGRGVDYRAPGPGDHGCPAMPTGTVLTCVLDPSHQSAHTDGYMWWGEDAEPFTVMA